MKQEFEFAILIRMSELLKAHVHFRSPDTAYSNKEIIEHMEEVIEILKNS